MRQPILFGRALAAGRDAGREELCGLVAAPERRDLSLDVGPELQTEARCNQKIAGEGLRARMQQQGIEIGGEEPRVRQQGPQRLQHQQLVVDVGAEDSNSLDAASILAPEPRIQLLDLIAQAVEIVELALSLGAVLCARIGPALGGVLAVLVLLVAAVPRAGAGARAVGIRHLTVQAAQIFERMQPVLAAKWITVGRLACGLSQASRHRIRQSPPVERIPLRDQRDVVALIDRGLNAVRVEGLPPALRETAFNLATAHISLGGFC